MGQLDDEGYAVIFVGGLWKITKGVMIVARGNKTGTLYMAINTKNTAALGDADVDSNLWHRRLGHKSEKGLKVLLSKVKLSGIKSMDIGLCEDYIFGKQKRVSFSKANKTPKTRRLELVHTDVCGPAPVASLGGSSYYVTFIDDSTRKVWVYFWENKSDVYDVFKR